MVDVEALRLQWRDIVQNMHPVLLYIVSTYVLQEAALHYHYRVQNISDKDILIFVQIVSEVMRERGVET